MSNDFVFRVTLRKLADGSLSGIHTNEQKPTTLVSERLLKMKIVVPTLWCTPSATIPWVCVQVHSMDTYDWLGTYSEQGFSMRM